MQPLGRITEYHREAQTFNWGWHLIMVLLVMGTTSFFALSAGANAEMAGFAWTAAALVWWTVIAAVGMFGAIVVSVRSDAVHVGAGIIGWPRWVFRLEDIEACQVTSFSFVREMGGFGVGPRRYRVCIFAAAGRGIELTLRNRKRRYVIGSNDPERLAAAINLALAAREPMSRRIRRQS